VETPILVAESELSLQIGLSDRGNGIGRTIVRRNGAVVSPQTETAKNDPKERVETYKIPLEQGINRLSVTAYDAQEEVDAGEPVQLAVNYKRADIKPDTEPAPAAPAPAAAQPNPSLPVLHVVSVGINKYLNPSLPKLENAAKDALSIADLSHKSRGSLFSGGSPSVLTEVGATRENIRKALKEVAAQAKPDDTVILFFAGHGTAVDGKYYFLPYDVQGPDNKSVKTSGLSQDAIAKLLAELRTARVAIILDTCYAGGIANQSTLMYRTARDRTLGNSLAQSTGRAVLTGTSNEQEIGRASCRERVS
jgi:hypothetical protein